MKGKNEFIISQCGILTAGGDEITVFPGKAKLLSTPRCQELIICYLVDHIIILRAF
jgi:hypothetical protein